MASLNYSIYDIALHVTDKTYFDFLKGRFHCCHRKCYRIDGISFCNAFLFSEGQSKCWISNKVHMEGLMFFLFVVYFESLSSVSFSFRLALLF